MTNDKYASLDRESLVSEIEALAAFRRFVLDNTHVKECGSCGGPKLSGYVCTHCGDDED